MASLNRTVTKFFEARGLKILEKKAKAFFSALFYLFITSSSCSSFLSTIDPLGRPIGSDHCFRTLMSLLFKNLAQQNKFQAKTTLATGETVGLAEWIMDDTLLLCFCFVKKEKKIPYIHSNR